MGEKRPFQERARIRTPAEIEGEIAKCYRWLTNGKLTPAKAKSRVDILISLLRTKTDNEKSGFSGGDGSGFGIEAVNIISIPRGWVVMQLFDTEAHMPVETYRKLIEYLPAGAFKPLRDEFLPPPIDDDDDDITSPPFLRVLENSSGDDDDFEQDPEPAA
jgi:hypothetical protein